MAMIHLAAAAVVLVLASGAARADWQYTRWGMSPDDVLRASKGAARIVVEVKPAPGVVYPGLKGRHRAGQTDFEARFFFNDNQLARIDLLPASASPTAAGRVERKLRERYGEPISVEDGGRVLVWRDETRSNRIILQLGDSRGTEPVAVLSYEVLNSEKG